MKKVLTIVLILCCTLVRAQEEKKWYQISSNTVAVMSLQVAGGYAEGWREEVLYHPNELFRRFPNLNRNFWDNRISWQNKRKFAGFQDANHLLKFANTSMNIASVVIKLGDIKSYKKKDRWKKIAFDALLLYASKQAGFFLAYNVTHRNKL